MADQRKQELSRDLAHARELATKSREGLSEDLRIGEKVKENLSRYRGVWIGGAILLGLIIAKIPPRTKKVPVVVPKGTKAEKELKDAGKVGVALAILKTALDIGKPFLASYIAKRVRQRV
jgi:hypothetical protein